MWRVKFITKNHGGCDWLRQTEGGRGIVGNCQFIFDPLCDEYDWLVVYDDFPRRIGSEPYRYERLACAPEQTILVTSEPARIKRYERAYTRQFGSVFTSQSQEDLPHVHAVRGPSTSLWYYGQGADTLKQLEDLRSEIPEKSLIISTVCSSKQQGHTLHRRRYAFTQWLKEQLPELEVYGHGVRPIKDKADAMDAYYYHIAIENDFSVNHWTEKLADAFLAGCLPFYYGCPNAEVFFPDASFIRIDLEDWPGALSIIREAIASGQYERRMPLIMEARRRVLEDHNLFVRLSAYIQAASKASDHSLTKRRVYSRHAARWRSPFATVFDHLRLFGRGF
ncbi:MAG: glycosyltransferase family 10 domain-containing protein [Opitutales bacterium]